MKYSTRNGTVRGSVVIPGSKSHTIRALLLATLAEGESVISAPLFSKDTEACINACRLLGAKLDVNDERIIVQGTGGRISPAET